MFDIGYSELLLIAVVALVVIGPKDLPNVMRTVGKWVGKARGMARHFRSGLDTMMREAELEEMEKKWREDNERIMREHPFVQGFSDPLALGAPPAQPGAALGPEPGAAGSAGAGSGNSEPPAPPSSGDEPPRELP